MITNMTGPASYNLDDAPVDAEFVIYRLEEAGAALLALPSTGYSTKLRTSVFDVVRDTVDAFTTTAGRIRPPPPDAARITRMDEAMGWIARIPPDRYVLRRIVGARSLVSPVTERHLFTWRRLATTLGADHKAVQRWHGQGIAMIVAALNGVQPGGVRPGTVRGPVRPLRPEQPGLEVVRAAGLAASRARAGS